METATRDVTESQGDLNDVKEFKLTTNNLKTLLSSHTHS